MRIQSVGPCAKIEDKHFAALICEYRPNSASPLGFIGEALLCNPARVGQGLSTPRVALGFGRA